MMTFKDLLDQAEPEMLGDLPETVQSEKVSKETARSVRRRVLGTGEAPKRVFRARRWLIPAVAALLIAAILVPTLIVMNRAPEPTAPAQNGAAGQAPEDEPQNDPAALPTEQTEPIASDPATVTSTNEETAARPIWKPKKNTSGMWPDMILATTELEVYPFVLITITGITDTTKESFVDDKQYWEYAKQYQANHSYENYTKVEYETVYCLGSLPYENNRIAVSDLIVKNHTDIYFSTKVLGKEIKVGDTVFCSVGGFDSYPELYAKCVPNASKKWNDYRIVTDGKLYLLDENYKTCVYGWNVYDISIDQIQEKIDSGYDVINKDLTSRIPTARLRYGCTVEEFIYICEWYKEFLTVAEIAHYENSSGHYTVF